MGWIYKVTNQINGKMYIGKTENSNPYERWKEHLRAYKKPRNEKRPFYDAMKKYGPDNFKFELIDEFENGQILSEKESEYIMKYRTYIRFKDCNGYNATLGGDGTSYLNLNIHDVIEYYFEMNLNVRQTAKHFKVSTDTIEKILDANNIQRLNHAQAFDNNYVLKHGGLVMLDYNGYMVIDVLASPRQYSEKYGFDSKNITKAVTRSRDYCTGKSQGYLWYRLNDLPVEYKEKLQDFYKRNRTDDIYSDTLPIDDTMLDL